MILRPMMAFGAIIQTGIYFLHTCEVYRSLVRLLKTLQRQTDSVSKKNFDNKKL